jgi:hypothetical protein
MVAPSLKVVTTFDAGRRGGQGEPLTPTRGDMQVGELDRDAGHNLQILRIVTLRW